MEAGASPGQIRTLTRDKLPNQYSSAVVFAGHNRKRFGWYLGGFSWSAGTGWFFRGLASKVV